MITVRSKTTKKELLADLQSMSEGSSELYVLLESLPSFLNTAVAFTIFIYQINSYPRSIVWVSANNHIFSTLRNVRTSLMSAEEYQNQTGINLPSAENNATPESYSSTKMGVTISGITTTPSPQLELKSPAKLPTELPNGIGSHSNQHHVNISKPVVEKNNHLTQFDAFGDSGKRFSDHGSTVLPNVLRNKTDESTSAPLIPVVPMIPAASITNVQDIVSKPSSESKLRTILSSQETYVQSGKKSGEMTHHSKILFDIDKVFESSPLIGDTNSTFSRADSATTSPAHNYGVQKQNLDEWLERLSVTKEALDSLKIDNSTESFGSDKPLMILENSDNQVAVSSYKSKKRFGNGFFVVGCLSMAALAVLSIVLFPTIAYTVTVKPEIMEESIQMSIPVDDFAKRAVKLETTASTTASGQKEVPTDRSIGKISLINPGNKDVTLDNGKFRLITNNREYEAVINSTLATTFSIPARNNLNGPAIEFTAQARGAGAEYNLSEGIQLDIVNFLGQKVCLNCYAITISAIQNSQISGEKIVSDADHSLLLGSGESNLAKKRLDELANIQEDKIFTNSSWFKNTSSNYDFSQPVGVTTPQVDLKVSVNTEIYYLPQEIVESLIKETNNSVDTINQIALVESSGSFTDDKNISIKVFYSYDKRSDLNTIDLKNNIKNPNCQEDPKTLQQQYPTIDYVDCRNLGVQVPGITPRVDVTIVNN